MPIDVEVDRVHAVDADRQRIGAILAVLYGGSTRLGDQRTPLDELRSDRDERAGLAASPKRRSRSRYST